jgi:DNA-binding transcriptional LysR family regulator
MDRIEALGIFVAVAERGSFIAAARDLGRSPAAISRAVASLEDRLAIRLFNRTTRSVALTDAGARYLALSRRLLADFGELQTTAASDQAEARGLLSVTASVVFGRQHVLPIVAAFQREHRAVEVRLLLLDRVVSLVDEGVDVGFRIARLADSSLRAIRAGSTRRAVYASPSYLAAHGVPRSPAELARHACIAFTGITPIPERWSFGAENAGITVALRPKLIVNTMESALDAAIAGLGLTCVLSYPAEPLVAAGLLQPVLQDYEPPPLPIHVVHPAGRHVSPTVRLFVDRAVAALRAKFGR